MTERRAFLGTLAAMVVQQQSLNNLSAEQLREMVASLMGHVTAKDALIARHQTELKHSQALNAKLTHENALLKRMKFAAQDDAAGLAISERMLTQVKGMDAARRNANDGISLAQVAEGSMQKMTDILQRGRELAVQAANGTNSRSDRQALFAEYSQLLQEFERMSQTANFNGHKLLDGSFTAQTFQVGANAGQTIDVSVPALKESTVGVYGRFLEDSFVLSRGASQGFNNWVATSLPAGRTFGIDGVEFPGDGILSMADLAEKLKSNSPKEILQDLPSCLIHVSMQWHPRIP